MTRPTILNATVGVVNQGTLRPVAKVPVGGTQDAMMGYALPIRKMVAERILRKGFVGDFLRHCWVVLKRSLSMPMLRRALKKQTTV